jgi:hypothetical protein
MDKNAYARYLNSPHWHRVRLQALQRAGFRCQGRVEDESPYAGYDDGDTTKQCESKTRLEVHHLNYDNLGSELPQDLLVLCRDCHHRLHHPRCADCGDPIDKDLAAGGAELCFDCLMIHMD